MGAVIVLQWPPQFDSPSHDIGELNFKWLHPSRTTVFILGEKETRRPHDDAFKGASSRALSKSEREISREADRRRLLSQD